MRSVFFPTFCLQYLHLLLPPLPYHPIDAAVIACPVLCYPIIPAMLSRPFDMLSHTVRCYLLLLFTSCPSTLLLTSATTYYAIRFLAMLLVIATSFLVLLPLVMFCYILFFLITRPHVFEHIFLATGPAFPSPTLIPLPWHLPSVLPFTPFTSFYVWFLYTATSYADDPVQEGRSVAVPTYHDRQDRREFSGSSQKRPPRSIPPHQGDFSNFPIGLILNNRNTLSLLLRICIFLI